MWNIRVNLTRNPIDSNPFLTRLKWLNFNPQPVWPNPNPTRPACFAMSRFGMNHTLSKNCSKPHIFNYKNPYMVYFQNTEKSHRKNLRFIRK